MDVLLVCNKGDYHHEVKHQDLKEMNGNRMCQRKKFQLNIPIVSDNQVLKEGRRAGLGLGERGDPERQGQGRGCG